MRFISAARSGSSTSAAAASRKPCAISEWPEADAAQHLVEADAAPDEVAVAFECLLGDADAGWVVGDQQQHGAQGGGLGAHPQRLERLLARRRAQGSPR